MFTDPAIDNFFKTTSFEKRCKMSQKLRAQYIDRIPIFIVRNDKSTPILDNIKFLSPSDLTFGKFVSEVRKKSPSIKETVALYFMLSNSILPVQNMTLGEIYQKYHSPDGFLYIRCAGENAFGKLNG